MKSDDSRSAKPGPKRSENRKMVTEQVNLILESDIRVDTKGRRPEKEDQPQSVANPTAHSIECVTVNASDSGLIIYSEKPLKSGSRFIIYSGKIWDIPKHGTVIWCKKNSRRPVQGRHIAWAKWGGTIRGLVMCRGDRKF